MVNIGRILHKEHPTPFEETVVAALTDIAKGDSDVAPVLRQCYINEAREVTVDGSEKAAVIFVPMPFLPKFQAVITELRQQLEKKLSSYEVFVVGSRTILPKAAHGNVHRPVSRTLTSVHKAVLDDLVYPNYIVGRRMTLKVDGTRTFQIQLDANRKSTRGESTFPALSAVYERLTGKSATFSYQNWRLYKSVYANKR